MRRALIKTSVGVAIATALAGCGSADENFKWTAEKNIARKLKDPDSAKFGKTFIVRKPANELGISEVVACGTIDGKNSFGAYTGGVRFVVRGLQGGDLLDISIMELDDPTESKPTTFEKVYWNAYCFK
ncbi:MULTISPECIES: hypothetical protein [Comamonas]|uniref:hypothetical protein n=1 Tax=Comamonas TaxID=283 RepID=UPI0001DA67EC|nr:MULTISPECIES: hypothetical protein [Comamonas]EFI60726.1 hypothetical protein CTS44_14918 [Comamonas thiooxydans]TFF63092.1 hypothetical protein EIC84_03340 [Comamonas sp. A23]